VYLQVVLERRSHAALGVLTELEAPCARRANSQVIAIASLIMPFLMILSRQKLDTVKRFFILASSKSKAHLGIYNPNPVTGPRKTVAIYIFLLI
jgi:hypothetical protein